MSGLSSAQEQRWILFMLVILSCVENEHVAFLYKTRAVFAGDDEEMSRNIRGISRKHQVTSQGAVCFAFCGAERRVFRRKSPKRRKKFASFARKYVVQSDPAFTNQLLSPTSRRYFLIFL